MLRSLFLWRLYAGFVLVIIVCTLITYVLLSDYIQDTSSQALEQDLVARSYLLKELSLPYFQEKTSESDYQQLHLLLKALDKKLASRFTVIDATGLVLADSRKRADDIDNHASRPEIIDAITKQEGRSERYSNTVHEHMKYFALAVEEQGELLGFVRTALPRQQILQQQQQLTHYVLMGCLITMLIALFTAFVIARRVSLPITALTQSAQAMAGGDYQQRVYLPNHDELGKLAKAFNLLAINAGKHVNSITEDRNKLATILSGLSEGVIALDSEENIIHINQAAAQTLNVSASACMGLSIWSSIHNAEIHAILQRVFTEGGVHQEQIRVPGKLKDTIINVYGAALEREDKRNGAILVLHDVSDLKMLENVRRDFVTNASHELKTPLTAIRGIIETITSDPDMDHDTLWHFLAKAQGQTDRLVNIVSGLMALSRLESGKFRDMEPLSIKAILKQSIKAFRNISLEKNIQLINNLDSFSHDNDPKVIGDAHSLGQLFDNLIDNAIKYTPEGGKVEVILKSQKADENANQEQGFLMVAVNDTGLGLSKIDQSRIFERFYRVDKGRTRELGGTGLGLAICKHIAEQHQGHIELESEIGRGSSFQVYLPEY